MSHFELRLELTRIRLVVPYPLNEPDSKGRVHDWKAAMAEALEHAVQEAEATDLARHRAPGGTKEHFLNHAIAQKTDGGHEVHVPTNALPNYVRGSEPKNRLIQAAATYLRRHYINEADSFRIHP